MFHIVLYQPEIPPNTGNIIRLCANVGAELHLIKPLGFTLEDKQLRRAGLDYHEFATRREYNSFDEFCEHHADKRLLACSTKGTVCYSDWAFQANDMLLLGPETRGLPETVLQWPRLAAVLRIPMRAGNRSLNLSNACAVIAYEAWRQLGFFNKP